MKLLRFEYRITIIYLLIGGLWILFSDKILYLLINENSRLSEFQTYKGWFYVIITAIILFFFIKKHLNKRRNLEKELKEFQNLLEKKVKLRTEELESAIKHLSETQAQLLQSEKMASLGILTAGVAHEINNPLNFIMGGYVGLQNYFNDSDTKKDENIPILLSSIKTGVDRASDIVKGLNQFSRNNDTLLETCDIHAIITNCLVILNTETFDRIEIKKEFSNDEIKITGNVGKLHQVFINILSNSIHAIEKHGVITIKTATQENTISIEISDTGCGISNENIRKISDPFFTTKEPGKGTGLGLSIAFRIIQDHKGKISFQSELNKGTTVIIILPMNPIL